MPTQTAGANKLDTIARNMRDYIAKGGASWSHQRLQRGLEVVLQREIEPAGAHRWRLALGRAGAPPSDNEIDICRRSFGVPVGAECDMTKRQRTSPKTRVTTTLFVAEMYWYEA